MTPAEVKDYLVRLRGDARRDIEKDGYPLPCDPVTGMGWWRSNARLCLSLPGYSEWQAQKRMDDIIPTLRWLVHGAIPA